MRVLILLTNEVATTDIITNHIVELSKTVQITHLALTTNRVPSTLIHYSKKHACPIVYHIVNHGLHREKALEIRNSTLMNNIDAVIGIRGQQLQYNKDILQLAEDHKKIILLFTE